MYGAQHFEKVEFREWSGMMSPRLISFLDSLRYQCGSAIYISPHPSALGRELGLNSQSCHNIDVWDEVLAVDCFVDHVTHRMQVASIVQMAKEIGFTGIGIYPEWKNIEGVQQCGFHFDVRPTEKMGSPATWGKVKGKYVSLEHALNALSVV